MRDGVPGLRDGRGDGGLARELLPLASPIMDHVHQRFLQHFVEQDVVGHMEADLDDDAARPRAPARGDRLRRPRRLHAADRGGGRGGGGRRRRALRRGGRGHAARRRARDQDDRRRGDGRRLRRRRRSSTGPSASRQLHDRARRCRASASTTARRSTATATTTAARSTSPRASARARPAARCSSRARSSRPPGAHLEFERSARCELKGFGEPTELFLARAGERRWLTTCSSACAPTGLLAAGRRRASCCSPAGATRSACSTSPSRLGAARSRALHVNYGLRDGGRRRRGALPRAVRAARRRARGRTAPRGPTTRGNLQAWARDVRYARGGAARGRRRRSCAAGHTATDQAETVLYRLAASPGRRALLGMRAARRAASCARCSTVTREETGA